MSVNGSIPTDGRETRSRDKERAELLREIADSGSERSSSSGIRPSDAFALLLFAVFAVALFAALALGTTVYGGIAADSDDARQLRQGTALLANTLRAHDAADAVSVGEGPEGPALVLTEHLDTGTFETYLYLQDGWVKQEYRPQGAPLAPDEAQAMVRSDTFSFDILGNAVRISTDQGETFVALRSDDAAPSSDEGGGQDA